MLYKLAEGDHHYLYEMIFYVIIILSFLAFYIYQNIGGKETKPQELKTIPFEKGLPIIGIVNQIQGPLCNYLWKLGQKHGPIYRIRMGMRDVVVLNTFDYIKTALVDNGHALSGRWKSLKYIFVSNNAGLAFIDGCLWLEQRSFVVKTLQDFGIRSSRSIEIVQEECARMLEELDHFNERQIDFGEFLPIYTANVISKFVMDKRFTHGDRDYETLKKYIMTTANQNDPFSMFFLLFPFLENNDWLSRFIMWISSRNSIVEECHKVFRREIKQHLSKLDLNSEGDNLMDRFLIKQHQMKENNGNVESFTDLQLVVNGLELIGAGYDTTSSLLVWIVMFMGMYPDVQNKVYDEIIDRIGNERLPAMEDKTSLDYTQAVMDEVLRVSTMLPLSVFRRTLNDVTIKDYFIPKDTVVISNIFACHLDQNVWEKPFEFYPEHFLSVNGDGVMKYRPREELIPFSMGKRQCMAESLGRKEYFIFFIGILQRFQVSLINENSGFDIFHIKGGMVRTPVIEEFIFKRRQEI